MTKKKSLIFKNIKLTHIAYAVIFTLFIIIIGFYSIHKADSINQRVNNIFTQELKPLETIEDIKASMYRIRERAGRLLTEPEKQVIHKTKIEQQLLRMKRNKEKYQQSHLNKTEIKLLKKMESSWQYYINIIEEKVIPLSERGEQEQAEDILYGSALSAFRVARQALNDLSDYQIQQAEHRQYKAQLAYTSILKLVLAIIIASLLLTILLIVRYKQTTKAKRFRDFIIRNTAQGLMVADKNLKITSVNKAFERITGYTEKEVLDHTPAILSSGRHDSRFYKSMWQAIIEKDHWEGEIWNKHKNGNIYPQWLSIIVLRSSDGDIESYIGTFIDISKLKAIEKKINKLAYYDDLTGLGNHYFLKEQLSSLLKTAQQKKYQIAVLLIDIDHFKDINASLGRNGGNNIIKEMAKLLKCKVPSGSIVVRYENDRFIVVLQTEYLDTQEFHHQIVKFIEKLQENRNFSINGENNIIKISYSIGISCFPKNSTNVNLLIEQANIALFHQKSQSNHIKYTFYQKEFNEKINYQYQLSLGIANAIEQNELFLVYQPQITQQGYVNGAEVLLRWHSKEFGIISPDIFIPLAEESGEINKIGRWVLENTLSQIKLWQEKCSNTSGCFKRIAINVSPHQIISSTAISEYAEICEKVGIDHKLIEFEITETGMMNFSENIIVKLQELAAQGFSLAIDDFGTGYSSLGRLQHFPIDILKIDRIFIKQILDNPSQAAIVKYIINMAHTLNMEVIAEGVESKDEVDMLIEFGCDMFQGYYFAKPLIADDFIVYVENQSSRKLLS